MRARIKDRHGQLTWRWVNPERLLERDFRRKCVAIDYDAVLDLKK